MISPLHFRLVGDSSFLDCLHLPHVFSFLFFSFLFFSFLFFSLCSFVFCVSVLRRWRTHRTVASLGSAQQDAHSLVQGECCFVFTIVAFVVDVLHSVGLFFSFPPPLSRLAQSHVTPMTAVASVESQVASGSENGEIVMHNISSFRVLARMKTPAAEVAITALAYNRLKRSSLLSAGADGSVHLWDTTYVCEISGCSAVCCRGSSLMSSRVSPLHRSERARILSTCRACTLRAV